MFEAAWQWAAGPGPPAGIFVLALLTKPHQWSAAVVDAVRERLR